jgi:hypothetical protein
VTSCPPHGSGMRSSPTVGGLALCAQLSRPSPDMIKWTWQLRRVLRWLPVGALHRDSHQTVCLNPDSLWVMTSENSARGGEPVGTWCFGRDQIRTFTEGETAADDALPLAGGGLALAAPVVISVLLGVRGDEYPTWLVWGAIVAALVGAALVAVAVVRVLRRRRRILSENLAFRACPNSPSCVQASLDARFTEPCSIPTTLTRPRA